MQRFSKKQIHMLTSPPSLLAWRLGSIHSGHCLLLKDLLCSHSQLRGEDRGWGAGGCGSERRGWSVLQDWCLF